VGKENMKRLSLRLFIALLTFIIGVAIATFWHFRPTVLRPSDKPVFTRTIEEENIAEAVFRYQFENCCVNPKYSVYFISRGDDLDPSDNFMKRFAGHNPPVKKVSQSVKVSDGVNDKETGERGVILGIHRIKWLNNAEIDVSVSEFVWGWGQSGSVCRVVRENDKWKVKGCKDTFNT
jgi:hypothetical protein